MLLKVLKEMDTATEAIKQIDILFWYSQFCSWCDIELHSPTYWHIHHYGTVEYIGWSTILKGVNNLYYVFCYFRSIVKCKMFFMSPQEVSHIHVSKSEWTLKQKVGASFKMSAWKQISIASKIIMIVIMIEGNIYIPWCPLVN